MLQERNKCFCTAVALPSFKILLSSQSHSLVEDCRLGGGQNPIGGQMQRGSARGRERQTWAEPQRMDWQQQKIWRGGGSPVSWGRGRQISDGVRHARCGGKAERQGKARAGLNTEV